MSTLPGVPLTPDTVRALKRAGSKVVDATAERDALIRSALAEGGSLREIGEAVGLSHTRVKQLGDRT